METYYSLYPLLLAQTLSTLHTRHAVLPCPDQTDKQTDRQTNGRTPYLSLVAVKCL